MDLPAVQMVIDILKLEADVAFRGAVTGTLTDAEAGEVVKNVLGQLQSMRDTLIRLLDEETRDG